MEIRTFVLVLAGAMLSVYAAGAQSFVWAKQIGVAGTALPPPPFSVPTVPSKVAVDAAGNVFVTGSFQATARFGLTNLTSAGGFDCFLASYDHSGLLRWALRGGGAGNDFASDVAVDPEGSVFITGTFEGTATFGNTNLTTTYNNLFVAKFDGDGTLLWAREGLLGGEGLGIATDGAGNSYCTGSAVLIEKRAEVRWQRPALVGGLSGAG